MHEFGVILSHIEKTTAFIDTSRLRKEGWRHLRVWRLRRQRIGFPKIAEEVGITEEDAKNSFYRAYELIEGKPYDQERYK